MLTHFNCPNCNKRLHAPAAAAGRKARCPACGQVTTVSAKSGNAPAESTDRAQARHSHVCAQSMTPPDALEPDRATTSTASTHDANPRPRSKEEVDAPGMVGETDRPFRWDLFNKFGLGIAAFCLIAVPVGVDSASGVAQDIAGGGIGISSIEVMWQLFLVTAPLVLAIATFVFSSYTFQLEGIQNLFLLTFLLGISIQLSQCGVGRGPVVPPTLSADWLSDQAVPIRMIVIIWHLLRAYWETYTPLPFIGAIALGVWSGVGIAQWAQETLDLNK